jgi:hypothetical protein
MANLINGGAGSQNGSYVLDATTVQDAFARDQVNAGDGANLVFAHVFGKGRKDRVSDLNPGDQFVEI